MARSTVQNALRSSLRSDFWRRGMYSSLSASWCVQRRRGPFMLPLECAALEVTLRLPCTLHSSMQAPGVWLSLEHKK